MQAPVKKVPYLTESARFYDYLSYSRLMQTGDHRFMFEIPIRKDFVPGNCWRRCYSDGTWSLTIEMAHKFYPRNTYMKDWTNSVEQSTVIATEEQQRKFRSQMENCEPVTLSDIADLDERIYHPDYGYKQLPQSSGSLNYEMRQWHDMEAPPPVPTWERDRLRVPVPQYHIPPAKLTLPPCEYQVQSQAATYRETGMSRMPDLTAVPSSFNEHLEQRDYIKQREIANQSGTLPVLAPQPLINPATIPTSGSVDVAPKPVKSRLGPRMLSDKPARLGSGPADPPLLHSRPYHVNYQLTSKQVHELNDGQLKRQLTALKRKYQRTLAEKRPNLGHLISQQITWYQAEQYQRKVGPFRPRKPVDDTTSSSGDKSTVATTELVTSASSAIHDVNLPSSSAISEPMTTEIVSLTPPPIPNRRSSTTPPSLPSRRETSAEKLYRMFLVDPSEDVLNQSYWSGEKVYLGGGLSDWSEIDSPDTQKRYERRHVKQRDKNPIITRREYRDKKLLALSRGYSGQISNSPYKKGKFCKDGRPEPPRRWKKEKRDKIREQDQEMKEINEKL